VYPFWRAALRTKPHCSGRMSESPTPAESSYGQFDAP
jgi:hypothetical protein